MANFEERMKTSIRRGSAVEIHTNPLESSSISSPKSVKVESVGSSHIVLDSAQFMCLLSKLRNAKDNEALLETLEIEKQPYLFNSADLLAIADLTTSIKTKLSIVLSLIPRLTDPKAKSENIVNLFRYAEDKSQVEEALKVRIQALKNALFRVNEGSPLLAGGRGGRGGRGLTSTKSMYMGGRGPGRPHSLPASLTADTVGELIGKEPAEVLELGEIIQKTDLFADASPTKEKEPST